MIRPVYALCIYKNIKKKLFIKSNKKTRTHFTVYLCKCRAKSLYLSINSNTNIRKVLLFDGFLCLQVKPKFENRRGFLFDFTLRLNDAVILYLYSF